MRLSQEILIVGLNQIICRETQLDKVTSNYMFSIYFPFRLRTRGHMKYDIWHQYVRLNHWSQRLGLDLYEHRGTLTRLALKMLCYLKGDPYTT